ncbi:cytochrome P-450 [Mactra antiquata]
MRMMDKTEILINPRYVIALVAIVFTIWYMRRKRYSKPLPPGPTPWPLIGNIQQFARTDIPFHKMAIMLQEKYGNIVKLHAGPATFIFLMGKETVHKATHEMNDKFKYRPNTIVVIKHFFNKGIVFSNGEVNSALRKYTLGAMREFGVYKRSLEKRIQEEAGILCQVLESKNGQPCYLMDNFKMAVSNIIAGIIYGNRFEYDDPVFKRLLSDIESLFKYASLNLPENYLPFLRFLPGSKFKKLEKHFKDLESYVRTQIEEHRATFDPENLRDFVDMFLKMEGSEDPVTTEDNLHGVIAELFNAGTDTTANTIMWGILLLITYPDTQKKLRAEILKVVGTERYIRLEDKRNMPYLRAFLNEVQRFAAVVSQTPPHTVLEDTEFEGYTIPKNSNVGFVLFTLLHDADVWGDPDNFRPERFLNEAGEYVELNKDSFIPFSAGGRSCIGKHLARMELLLFFGTLVQKFEFKAPPGADLPSLERLQSELTCYAKPYEMCAIPFSQ